MVTTSSVIYPMFTMMDMDTVEFNMHDFIFACAYLIDQHQFDVFMDETT